MRKITYVVSSLILVTISWIVAGSLSCWQSQKSIEFLPGLMVAPISVTLMFGSISVVITSLAECAWMLVRRRKSSRSQILTLAVSSIAAMGITSMAVLAIAVTNPLIANNQADVLSRQLVAYVLAQGGAMITGVAIVVAGFLYLAMGNEKANLEQDNRTD